MAILDAGAIALIDATNFAVLATLRPDGSPQSSTVWVLRDGDDLLFSITGDKQKAANLRHDPRVSVSVFDLTDPYRSIEVRGTAELRPDPERELPRRLARKYLGTEPPQEDTAERLVVRVRPAKVIHFAP